MSLSNHHQDRPLAAERQTLVSAEQQRSRLAELVHEDGTVDIDTIYQMGRVPATKITAEAVFRALVSLPADIPDQARRAALKSMLAALGAATGVPTQDIVADADIKRKRLTQYLTSLNAELGGTTTMLRTEVQEMEAELQRLETRLAERRATLARYRFTQETAARVCNERITALDEVTRLLGEPKASSSH